MLGASEPWSVLKTRTPVNAARMPIRAVSSSRISPIMMTSGSWRSIARKPFAEAHLARMLIWRLVHARDAVLDRVFDRHDVPAAAS